MHQVVACGLCALRGIAPRRNCTEEPQGVGCIAPLLMSAGERQGSLGEGMRLPQATTQHLRLPQRENTERLVVGSAHGKALFPCRREERHGVGNAPIQGVPRAQGRSNSGEKARQVGVLADAHGPFEQGQCRGQVALAEG